MSPTGPVFLPDDAVGIESFKDEVILACGKPTNDDVNNFVVTAEPIHSGKIGRAYIFGVCAVLIDVQSNDDTVCGATAGVTGKLKSGTGSNQIIWKQPGTGDKWAVIRIGGSGGGDAYDHCYVMMKESIAPYGSGQSL